MTNHSGTPCITIVILYSDISHFNRSTLVYMLLYLPHKVKTQYLHFRSQWEYFLLLWKIPAVMSNLLVWKWIDQKFDIKWMYLLCFIFVDTAFLLCGADISQISYTALLLRLCIALCWYYDNKQLYWMIPQVLHLKKSYEIQPTRTEWQFV